MKKPIMAVFILIVLLATMACQGFMIVKGETQDIGFTIRMTVTYSNPSNGTRVWNFTEEDRTISLFMNNTWQTVYLISHSYPLETMKNDEDGNPIVALLFPKSELKPGENMSYTVAYYVVSKHRQLPSIVEEKSETIEDIPTSLSEIYCREEGPWLVYNPVLQELAYNIAKNETRVLTVIKKFVAWINQNITYAVHEVPMYPNETYVERSGDCDDKAVLFATLCRIYGIPAYVQIGCIYLPKRMPPLSETSWEGHVTNVLKQIGWHGWAITYVPPWGWLPVDLTYVIGGLGDPLNAIKSGAVTFQETIQYMNVTRTDYVASSRGAREFLKNNDFYVYMEDEMIQDPSQRSLWEEILDKWLQWILIAMVAVAFGGALIYIRKAGKAKLING